MKVTGERVDAVVAEDVALLKMDVEGFEPTAFESAKGVLDTFRRARAGRGRGARSRRAVPGLEPVGLQTRSAAPGRPGQAQGHAARECRRPRCFSCAEPPLTPSAGCACILTRATQRYGAALAHCAAAMLATRCRRRSPGSSGAARLLLPSMLGGAYAVRAKEHHARHAHDAWHEGGPLRRSGRAQGGEHCHGVLARRVRHHAPLGGLPGLAAHAHLVRAPAGMRGRQTT